MMRFSLALDNRSYQTLSVDVACPSDISVVSKPVKTIPELFMGRAFWVPKTSVAELAMADRDNLGWALNFGLATANSKAVRFGQIGMAATREDDCVYLTCSRERERGGGILSTSLRAFASPRFIDRRSASTVLNQDCLGRPIIRLQLSGGPAMQAWRARLWSWLGSAWWRCPKKDIRRQRTVSDRNGCPVRDPISSLVTNSDQCMFRIRLRHQIPSMSIVLDKVTPLQSPTMSQHHIGL